MINGSLKLPSSERMYLNELVLAKFNAFEKFKLLVQTLRVVVRHVSWR